MKENGLGLSRREFLQRGVAAAAGAALGSGWAEAHGREAETQLEQWNRLNTKINQLIVSGYHLTERVGGKHEYTKWEQYDNASHYFSPREAYPVTDMDQARVQALTELGQTGVQEYVTAAFKAKKLPEAYRALYELDLHGLLTAFMAERGLYGQFRMLYDGQYWGDERIWEAHFAGRAADYLPTGKHIFDEEIDPRLLHVDKTGTKPRDSFSGTMTEDVHDMPNWARPERQALFRTALDHPKIRALLQASDCSLVETYSILKMALLESNYQIHDRLPKIITRLLKARQQFLKTTFLNYRTESYISLTYTEASEGQDATYLNTRYAQVIGAQCLVPDSSQQHFDSTSSIHSMQQAIAESNGETCVFVNAHGRMNGDIRIREGKDGVVTAANLAGAWLERLHRTGDTATLGIVHMILGSCSSADYAFHLRQAFMQAYHDRPMKKHGRVIPIQDIVLPTMVALSSLGSVTYDAAFFESYERHSMSIGYPNGLDGAYLMRKMQPAAYPLSDMSFFTDTHGQTPFMMGQTNLDTAEPQLA